MDTSKLQGRGNEFSRLTCKERHGFQVLVRGLQSRVHIQGTILVVANVQEHVVRRRAAHSRLHAAPAADVQEVGELVGGRLVGGRGGRNPRGVRVVGVEEIVPEDCELSALSRRNQVC